MARQQTKELRDKISKGREVSKECKDVVEMAYNARMFSWQQETFSRAFGPKYGPLGVAPQNPDEVKEAIRDIFTRSTRNRARMVESVVSYGSVAVLGVTLLGGYVYYCIDRKKYKGYAPVVQVVKDGNA